jgi:hypothetical protein
VPIVSTAAFTSAIVALCGSAGVVSVAFVSVDTMESVKLPAMSVDARMGVTKTDGPARRECSDKWLSYRAHQHAHAGHRRAENAPPTHSSQPRTNHGHADGRRRIDERVVDNDAVDDTVQVVERDVPVETAAVDGALHDDVTNAGEICLHRHLRRSGQISRTTHSILT